jgi:hypothetical protein
MTVPQVCLDAGDAVELGEMLGFIGDGVLSDRECLAESLRRFVGVDGYDIEQLLRDLSRFGFLLGVSDGDLLFGGDER